MYKIRVDYQIGDYMIVTVYPDKVVTEGYDHD